MQYYKKTEGMRTGEVNLFMTGGPGNHVVMPADYTVNHRNDRSIPGILPAKDVFVEEDGHLTIKNPSKPYRPAY